MRTKALSKATEKDTPEQGLAWVEGGKRGSLRGRVRRLRRLRTGVSEVQLRNGGRILGRGGTADRCWEGGAEGRRCVMR